MKYFGVLIALLILSSCETLGLKGDKSNRPKTQAEAVRVSVSAMPPLPFALVRDRLKPKFQYKSASELYQLAVENSLAEYASRSGSTSAGLSLNLPGTAIIKSAESNSASTTEDGDTATSSSQADSRNRTLSPGERPTGFVPEAGLASNTPGYGAFDPGLDLGLAIEAANYLYQNGKLYDAYFEEDITREGWDAWVVRLNIAVEPRMRNMPYDLGVSLEFGEDKAGDDGVKLVPLFATGDYEVSSLSSLASQLNQLNANLTAVSAGTGVGAGLQKKVNEILDRAGKDVNTRISVGFEGKRSIRVNLPAANQVNPEYELRNQSYTVTLLIFVPDGRQTSPNQRGFYSRQIPVRANWDLVAVDSGRSVPLLDSDLAAEFAATLNGLNSNEIDGSQLQTSAQRFYNQAVFTDSIINSELKSRSEIINEIVSHLPPNTPFEIDALSCQISNAKSLSRDIINNKFKQPETDQKAAISALGKFIESCELQNATLEHFVDDPRDDFIESYERAVRRSTTWFPPSLALIYINKDGDYQSAFADLVVESELTKEANSKIFSIDRRTQDVSIDASAFAEALKRSLWFKRGIAALENPRISSVQDLLAFRDGFEDIFGRQRALEFDEIIGTIAVSETTLEFIRAEPTLPEKQLAIFVDDGKESLKTTITGAKNLASDDIVGQIYVHSSKMKNCSAPDNSSYGPFRSLDLSVSNERVSFIFPSLLASLGNISSSSLCLHVLVKDSNEPPHRYEMAMNTALSGFVPARALPYKAELVWTTLSQDSSEFKQPDGTLQTSNTVTLLLSVQNIEGQVSQYSTYLVKVQNGSVGLDGPTRVDGAIPPTRTQKEIRSNSILVAHGSIVKIRLTNFDPKSKVKVTVIPLKATDDGKPPTPLESLKTELEATIQTTASPGTPGGGK